MKYAIFGDVGGHFGPLKTGLKKLGVDMKDFVIPDGLTIVQVGDLVHKGPNSALVVETVDILMKNNPGKWIQMAGNHELPYVTNHPFFSQDRVDARTSGILKSWKNDGLIHPSFAFSSSTGKDYLVTHAGFTRPNYLKFGLESAFEINEALRSSDWKDLMQYGVILSHGLPNNEAGVFWAEAVSEVYASWYKAPNPASFNQIHGHVGLVMWKTGKFRLNYADWVTQNLEIDFENMQTRWASDGKSFYAIDHDLGRRTFTNEIKPLVIE